MVYSTTTVLGAMLAMAPLTAHAHMIMAMPVPFRSMEGKEPDQAPLELKDFPCKNPNYERATVTDWPAGSTQNLTLFGTAVHGGGSCQVSVTLDKAPTKASKWKVIHSWEGACPIPPLDGGNFKETEDKNRPPFPFMIPSELPNGEMTMSWTWFNKVGNREFYQNCAAVKVSGGAPDNTAFDALPDMAVANIEGINTCKTSEAHDYTFENPGKYVTKGGTGPFKPICGGASTPGTPGGAVGGGASGGAGSSGGPAPPANPGIPSPVAPISPGTQSAASSNMGASSQAQGPVALSSAQASTLRTIITVTAPSGPPPAGMTPVPGPSSQAAAVPPPQVPASPSAAPIAPGAPLPAGQACSPDGAIICRPDGKQFGLCNFGNVLFQAVADGTTCSGGKIARRYDPSTLRTIYA
jgi:hypothetical protein